MTPKQKKDIVCCFHGDLENWMKSIDGKLDKLRLSNAKLIGGLIVMQAVVVIVAKVWK
jgi:hypothetical protein